MRQGRLLWFLALVLAVPTVVALLWWASGPARRAQSAYQHALDSTLVSPRRALRASRRFADPAVVGLVRAIYRHRHGRALWLKPSGVQHRIAALRKATELLRAHGIDPEPYGLPAALDLVDGRSEPNELLKRPSKLAALEVRLTAGLAASGRDLLWGRLPPGALDDDWRQGRDSFPLAGPLERAASRGAIVRQLDAWTPHHPEYQALRKELALLRATKRAGGWTKIGAGPELRLGMRGARVALLRKRLAESGDLGEAQNAAEPDPGSFDRSLASALKRAQLRHGLEPSGRLEHASRAALDRPIADRIRQLELNLERWRWLPRTRGEPRIEVNLPDFTFAMWDSGRAVLRMRVVIGSKTHPTPIFSDSITYIEMNPTWRLPKRILVEEVIPEIEKDTTYLSLNHMRILFTKKRKPVEVPVAGVDWSAVEADSFPYLVVQDAGADNPLGRIKFMCPNEYDVYLHDTPSQGQFHAGARDRSHGCVRLERPLDLAERLLQEHPSGSRDSIEAILAAGLWRRLRLKKHVPLDVLYWTAWVDSAGALQFRDDVYGLDRRLDAALRSGRTRGFEINPEVLWGEKKLAADAAEER